MTIPKPVRDALGINTGAAVVFRVEGNRAVMARAEDFLELAGTIHVAAGKLNATWDDVLARTRSERGKRASV